MFEKTIEELLEETRESLVVDLRKEADFRKETYPGAKHIWWEAQRSIRASFRRINLFI